MVIVINNTNCKTTIKLQYNKVSFQMFAYLQYKSLQYTIFLFSCIAILLQLRGPLKEGRRTLRYTNFFLWGKNRRRYSCTVSKLPEIHRF